MASYTLMPGKPPANMSHRQIVRHWRRCITDFTAVTQRVIKAQDDDDGELLKAMFAILCDLLLAPAPDLEALRTKCEIARTYLFAADPCLRQLMAAIVDDVGRLAQPRARACG